MPSSLLRPQISKRGNPGKGEVIRRVKFNSESVAIVAAIVLLAALYFATLMFTGAKVGATTAPSAESPRALKSCSTVPAKTYNNKLRIRRTITGNAQRFRSKPVCVDRWRSLLRSIKKQRRVCKANAITTGATWYGGSGDSMTSGTSGAYGDLSNHPWSFAELGMGSAMGGLAPLSWWYVHSLNNGRTKRAQKRDIGGGGGPVNGHTRGFDAWHPLAQYLGLMGNGTVHLAKRNCWA